MLTEGAPAHVFHITQRSAFAAALESGSYEADSLPREGFIHCSTRAQVLRSAGRFYAGQSGLVILCIAAARLGPQLRYEPADRDLFPHCYGPIALDAIAAVIDFPCRADGGFDVPEELSLFGS